MGNIAAGYGFVNDTEFMVHCAMYANSTGVVQRFEANIKPGEVFYRPAGLFSMATQMQVWMAFPGSEVSVKQIIGDVTCKTVAVVAGVATVITAGAASPITGPAVALLSAPAIIGIGGSIMVGGAAAAMGAKEMGDKALEMLGAAVEKSTLMASERCVMGGTYYRLTGGVTAGNNGSFAPGKLVLTRVKDWNTLVTHHIPSQYTKPFVSPEDFKLVFTEKGYKAVAKYHDPQQMGEYVKAYAESLGYKVVRGGGLTGFSNWYNGVSNKNARTLAEMKAEFPRKIKEGSTWISKK